MCGLWNKEKKVCMYLQAKYTILNKKNIGDGFHMLSPYWKNDLPPITKRFKASHTEKILENVFFRMQRGSNYKLVEFLGCKPSANSLVWHPSLNLNLFVAWSRSFSRTVSVCDPLNISVVGGKSFCSTVTLCDHFPSSAGRAVSGEARTTGQLMYVDLFTQLE